MARVSTLYHCEPKWWTVPLLFVLRAWRALGLPLSDRTIERIAKRAYRTRAVDMVRIIDVERISAQANAELANVRDLNALEVFRQRYLSSQPQGELRKLAQGLVTARRLHAMPEEELNATTQRLDAVREQVTQAFEAKLIALDE